MEMIPLPAPLVSTPLRMDRQLRSVISDKSESSTLHGGDARNGSKESLEGEEENQNFQRSLWDKASSFDKLLRLLLRKRYSRWLPPPIWGELSIPSSSDTTIIHHDNP